MGDRDAGSEIIAQVIRWDAKDSKIMQERNDYCQPRSTENQKIQLGMLPSGGDNMLIRFCPAMFGNQFLMTGEICGCICGFGWFAGLRPRP